MVDLRVVIDTIRALEKQDELTQEDVLGIYMDIVNGLRYAGQPMDTLPVKDPETLAQNLAVCGSDFLGSMRRNKELLSSAANAERIQRLQEKLSQRKAELDQCICEQVARKAELDKEAAALEEGELAAESRMEALKKDWTALEEKRRRLQTLEQACLEVAAENEGFKNISLTEVRNQKIRLDAERTRLNEQLHSEETELGLIQQNINGLKKQLLSLEKQKVQWQKEKDSADTVVAGATAKVREMQQLVDGCNATLEEQRSRLRTLEEECRKAASETEQLKTVSLKEAGERKENLEAEQKKLRGEIYSKENKIKELEDNVSELSRQNSNLQQTKLERQREKDRASDAVAALETDLAGIRKEKNRLDERAEQLRQKQKELEEENEKLLKDCAKLEGELDDASRRHDEAKKKFQSFDRNYYLGAIKEYEEKTRLLRYVQTELCKEFDMDLYTSTPTEELRAIENKTQKIDDLIRDTVKLFTELAWGLE